MQSFLKLVLSILPFAVLGVVAPTEEHAQETQSCRLTLSLVDAQTGAQLSGVVQIVDSEQKRISPANLLNRGRGLKSQSGIRDWCVLVEPTRVEVPRGELTVRAFSGLETEVTTRTLDLTHQEQAVLKIPLTRFYKSREAGFQNANTHVHLRNLTRAQSDKYLTDVGRADGLDIVFVSYLERAGDDVDYITNEYSRSELQGLSTDHVRFGHGEEHRHNFAGFGQGYGHVMLLDIPELIQPVSIGPGIAKTGTDGIPLRRGIDEARRLGGKVIWCHNAWGLEDVPSWLEGRLHANNIFDGGTHGSYRHSFYRYLSAGIKVPFSTGTDWFIYDFSRVYVPTAKPLTVPEWLNRLAQGRSYITNGPLLEFSVNGAEIGEDVSLARASRVKVRGSALGRVDFQRIELIQNGNVIHHSASTREDGHYRAEMSFELAVEEPCWIALRTPPPSVPDDPDFQTQTPLNEYGRELFSHTSATFIDVAGNRVFDRAAAEELLNDMLGARELILEQGLYADDAERRSVLAVYDAAIRDMQTRLQVRQ